MNGSQNGMQGNGSRAAAASSLGPKNKLARDRRLQCSGRSQEERAGKPAKLALQPRAERRAGAPSWALSRETPTGRSFQRAPRALSSHLTPLHCAGEAHSGEEAPAPPHSVQLFSHAPAASLSRSASRILPETSTALLCLRVSGLAHSGIHLFCTHRRVPIFDARL